METSKQRRRHNCKRSIPQGVGANQAFLNFVNSRYPVGNDPGLGDGLNTTGFLFNAPDHRKDNIYTGRLDYSISSKHKLFGRIQQDRFNDDQTAPQFPGDPNPLVSNIDHSRSWVVGETWTISNNLINQAFGGLTRQVDDFPINYAPTAPNIFTTSLIADPYGDIRGQGRNVAVPEFRDDLSYTHGKHSLDIRNGHQADPRAIDKPVGREFRGDRIGRQHPCAGRLDTSGGHFQRSGGAGGVGQRVSFADWADTAARIHSSPTTNQVTPLAPYSTTQRDFHYNEYEFYAPG